MREDRVYTYLWIGFLFFSFLLLFSPLSPLLNFAGSLSLSSFLLTQVKLYPDSGPSLIPLVFCEIEYPDAILSLGKAADDPGNITVRMSTHFELAVVIIKSVITL